MRICLNLLVITLIVPTLFGLANTPPQATSSDKFDFRGIPEPYNFYHYQALTGGEWISVGGEGDFLYVRPDGAEYRSRVGDVDLNSVYFTDSKAGWVVGAAGSVYRTNDGGKTWSKQPTGLISDLLAITCVNKVSCWITGNNGVILRTRNGKDWTKLPSPVTTSLIAVDFLNDKTGLAIGKDLILKTNDGGLSWQKQIIIGGEGTCNGHSFSESPGLTSVTIFSAEAAWIAAVDGVARYSSATERWEGTCIAEAGPLAGIVTQDGRTVFAIGSNGENAVSSDSGTTWKSYSPPGPHD